MSRRWRIWNRLPRGRYFALPPILDQRITVDNGIPSAEAWGTPFVNDGVVRPTSIASTEAWGTPTVTPGSVTVTVDNGVASSESWGTPFLTLTFDLTTLTRTARTAIGYELVCVARIMQPSGSPQFVEIDDIKWEGLAYTDELSRPQSLQAAAPVETLPESVLTRLRDLRRNPCELWLYRNGQKVFAGPLLAFNTQGGTMTFNAQGLLGYLRYWFIDTDTTFTQIDQHIIVQTLVNNWQNTDYANYGIDTSAIAASGVLRDHTYKVAENHNIAQRVEELGKRINGFDTAVDPTTRQLQLFYPAQGSDRSNDVVFDEMSITSVDIACSVAPGDIASDAQGTGTGSEVIWNTVSDSEVRATFGRAAVAESFDGVQEESTLLDHLNGLLASRKEALLVPGPSMRVTSDVPLSAYGVGDVVSFRLHQRLGIEGTFRIRKRVVSVSDTGVEKVTLEFA